jgi:hypothetical protein
MKREGWANAALLLLYAALTFLLSAHHEPWRDETHAFLLARGPSTIVQLLVELRVGEVQPPLWHLLLRAVSGFTDNFRVVGVLHGLIMVSAVALLLWRSPFRSYEKLLLCLSYYLLFEYAVVIRHYGLTVLLFFASLCVRGTGRPPYLLRCLCWAALAQTNSLGAALAGALWLTGLARRDRTAWWGDVAVLASLASGLYFMTGVAMDVVEVQEQFRSVQSWRAAGEILSIIANRMFVQMRFLPGWEPAWMIREGGLLLTAAVGFVAFVLLAPKRGAAGRFAALSSIALLVLYMVIARGAYLRHHGFLWVALVGALWMERAEHPAMNTLPPVRRYAFLLLLAGSLWSSVQVAKAEWRCLYSEARHTAEQLRSLDRTAQEPALWVAVNSGVCEGLLAFLPEERAEFYSLEMNRPYRYLVHGGAWKEESRPAWIDADGEIAERFDRVMRASGRSRGILIKADKPLDLSRATGIPMSLVPDVDPPCVMTHMERFYLYEWKAVR